MRTTEEAVRLIIETDLTVASSLAPFIEAANHLVNRCCSGEDYTADELELIERWLSAHFYAIRDPRRASETVGPMSETFQYKVDLNLSQTVYGQQAMLLDYLGGLAALNKQVTTGVKKITPGVEWLGTVDWDTGD